MMQVDQASLPVQLAIRQIATLRAKGFGREACFSAAARSLRAQGWSVRYAAACVRKAEEALS